jgi:dolichol-phosphate mannosyltransferase
MKLSVIIPAKNEEGCVEETVTGLVTALRAAQIPYEILIVDDGSTDSTVPVVERLIERFEGLRLVSTTGEHGYGIAVRTGLRHFTGDAVAIMMADNSDSPRDLIAYYNKLQEGSECVFGSRFIPGGKVVDYPKHKLILNRLANRFIMMLFRLRCNDITNAFKCYRREVIEGMEPFLSPHFNLTVEMPLKAIVRGYSYTVIPIAWTNRKAGTSKLKIKEMGSRYLFIVLYIWLEKQFSRGDYRRRSEPVAAETPVGSRHA